MSAVELPGEHDGVLGGHRGTLGHVRAGGVRGVAGDEDSSAVPRFGHGDLLDGPVSGGAVGGDDLLQTADPAAEAGQHGPHLGDDTDGGEPGLRHWFGRDQGQVAVVWRERDEGGFDRAREGEHDAVQFVRAGQRGPPYGEAGELGLEAFAEQVPAGGGTDSVESEQ